MCAHRTGQGPRAPAGPALGPGSLRRIVDVPFETCVTKLDSWQQAGQGGEVRFGDSLLCGPAERDPARLRTGSRSAAVRSSPAGVTDGEVR
jgi:hypothetical protein